MFTNESTDSESADDLVFLEASLCQYWELCVHTDGWYEKFVIENK